jgi:hypothetical protein
MFPPKSGYSKLVYLMQMENGTQSGVEVGAGAGVSMSGM